MEKKQLRVRLIQERQQLPSRLKHQYDRKICLAIKSFLDQQFSELPTLCGFMSIKGEPDLGPLLEDLVNETRIYLPVLQKQEMEFWAFQSVGEMKKNQYGILEPVTRNLISRAERCVLLAPCVGISRSGYRLGYGGGYYDKYLAQSRPCAVVGISYGFAINQNFKAFDFDIPLDYVISENGLSRFEEE